MYAVRNRKIPLRICLASAFGIQRQCAKLQPNVLKCPIAFEKVGCGRLLRDCIFYHVPQIGLLRQTAFFRVAHQRSILRVIQTQMDQVCSCSAHYERLSDEQILMVEARVNQMIRQNYPLEEVRKATMEQAKEMGAIALFGEKYGDRVRVVKFGPSVELCGGCHTNATGTIGQFKIVSESAIAAGVRRIEAVTAGSADLRFLGMESTIKQLKMMLGNPVNVVSALARLLEDNAQYRKTAEEDEKKRASILAEKLVAEAKEIGGIKVVEYTETKRNPVLVRSIAALVQKQTENTVFAGAFAFENKPNLVLAYSNDLVKAGRNAGQTIREAAKCIQGGGGGQASMATAGGRDVNGLAAALEIMKK